MSVNVKSFVVIFLPHTKHIGAPVSLEVKANEDVHAELNSVFSHQQLKAMAIDVDVYLS